MAHLNKRGPNFSFQEVEKLIHLVRLHSQFVNNKGTDAVTNALKIDAWKAIEKVFNENGSCSIYRPHYVLRTKYDNLKRLYRRSNAARRHPNANESSDVNPVPDDSEVDILDFLESEVAATKIRSGFTGNFDSNMNDSSSETVECPFTGTVKEKPVDNNVAVLFPETNQKELLNETDNYEEIDEGTDAVFEWKTISRGRNVGEPQDSSITQSSEEPFFKKRKYCRDRLISEESSQREFDTLSKKAFLEKHNLTLKTMKEEAEQRLKHEAVMYKLQEEELRLRIQFMKEKHEVSLQLMKNSR